MSEKELFKKKAFFIYLGDPKSNFFLTKKKKTVFQNKNIFTRMFLFLRKTSSENIIFPAFKGKNYFMSEKKVSSAF